MCLFVVCSALLRAAVRISGYIDSVLGLPDGITACLFDLDGVLTGTATVHNAAWTEMFDDFLRVRAERTGQPYVAFDPVADYNSYVDGRPRADGVRTFLASRGITLPDGSPNDPPRRGDRARARQPQERDPAAPDPRPGRAGRTRARCATCDAAAAAGLRRAVVSASANCAEVLGAAGLEDLLEVRVDGVVAAAEAPARQAGTGHVPGRGRGTRACRPRPPPCSRTPSPGCRRVAPAGSATWSGWTGSGTRRSCDRHGASVVVHDLAELLR